MTDWKIQDYQARELLEEFLQVCTKLGQVARRLSSGGDKEDLHQSDCINELLYEIDIALADAGLWEED